MLLQRQKKKTTPKKKATPKKKHQLSVAQSWDAAAQKQAAAPNQSQEVAVPDVACNLKDEGAAKVDFERQAHHFPATNAP